MMSEEDSQLSDQQHTDDPSDLPEIEDAYEDGEATAEVVDEDDPEFLDPTSRSLQSTTEDADDGAEGTPATVAERVEADDTTDAGRISEEPADEAAKEPAEADWANECSAQRVALELKRIEAEVRRILEDRDTRRKRKLGGTRRWHELEEDLITWRHSGRFDDEALTKLGELIAQRHFLFKRLRFLTGTRPVWNT